MQKVRIIRSQRKTISIEIHPGGEVWVRAPRRLPEASIDELLAEKQTWINRKLAELEKQRAGRVQRSFIPGELFLYQGKEFPLNLSSRTGPALVFENGGFFLARSALERAEAHFEAWYRTEAQRVYAVRVAFHAARTGLRPAKVRLSSARTRWGSCSTSGTLSLNWRLILAPAEILDYVILHELAHIKIKNHQRAFWELLGKMLPDYTQRRKWLKDHGAQLVIR